MPTIAKKMTRLFTCVLGLAVVLGAGSPAAGPTAMSQAETDGYLQWLYSLEKSVGARAESALGEANLLYPFDLPAWDLDDPRPYRHLSISKAVTELEAQWNTRGNGNLNSTLMALANARNYVNLSEYDSALVWYQVAAGLDSTGSFQHEIATEGLACAVSANDSLSMARLVAGTLSRLEIAGREQELVLAYRWLLTDADSTSLQKMVDKVGASSAELPARLRFWHAYALNRIGRREDCLVELRQLLLNGGLSLDLAENQRSWVLVAVADTYFLLGDNSTARTLYGKLAVCGVSPLRMWGKHQTAGLDFIDNLYLRAGNGFQEVCEGTRYGAWQDHACAMVDITRELERIKAEGEPYGVANFYRP